MINVIGNLNSNGSDITSDALNFVVNKVVIQYCVYYEI